ncbi:MAG: hypothetical protein HOM88_03120 [Hellea sp.]|jgi:hypothetical protein|nr:hypothetical protein [Hellea sp.]
MVKPNTSFNLDVDDINIIDEALLLLQMQRTGTIGFEIEDITNLRAKIFHQKNWYKPKDRFAGGG